MALEDPAYTGDDTREFGPEKDICPHCGGDLVDEGHEPSCEWHPDFYEPRGEYNREDDDAA